MEIITNGYPREMFWVLIRFFTGKSENKGSELCYLFRHRRYLRGDWRRYRFVLLHGVRVCIVIKVFNYSDVHVGTLGSFYMLFRCTHSTEI